MLKQTRPAFMMVFAFIIVTGLLFPTVVTIAAKAVFPDQANGSLIKKGDQVIGSRLIGQNFADPKYFHPRPSNAGSGYDAANSSGTNLGPTSDKLINGIHKKLPDGKDDPGNFDGIKDLTIAFRKENGLAAGKELPADAVTRSASGLDPHISLENALLQAQRVATARKISVEEVKTQIEKAKESPLFGILVEPYVNVLMLNLAMDEAHPVSSGR